MDKYVIRTLQGLLGIAALICVAMMTVTARCRKPYLREDPSSIAGIAALIRHPLLLHDLQAENLNAQTNAMRYSFPDRRYGLQHYRLDDDQWTYGISPVDGSDCDLIVESTTDGLTPSLTKDSRQGSYGDTGHRESLLQIATAVIILGLLGVLVAYYKDGSDSAFNRFFNSDTFGPRFILTGLATTVAMSVEALHQGTCYHKILAFWHQS
jgi:hypothetical protein